MISLRTQLKINTNIQYTWGLSKKRLFMKQGTDAQHPKKLNPWLFQEKKDHCCVRSTGKEKGETAKIFFPHFGFWGRFYEFGWTSGVGKCHQVKFWPGGQSIHLPGRQSALFGSTHILGTWTPEGRNVGSRHGLRFKPSSSAHAQVTWIFFCVSRQSDILWLPASSQLALLL